MKIALSQFAPRLGDVPGNLALHLETIAAAKKARADLVVFPELSLTGYLLRDLIEEVALDPKTSKAYRRLAEASRDLALVFGFVLESPREKGLFYNAAACLSKGRTLHIHRKVFLPTSGMFEERRFFAEGRSFRAFDAPWGRTGLMICRDFLHFNAHYLLFADGAETVLTISAAPGRGLAVEKGFASSRMWEVMGEAAARLLTTTEIYCNRVGFEDGMAFGGGSFAFDPRGALLGQAAYFDPELLIVDVPDGAVRAARKVWPFKRDDKPEVTLAALSRIVHGHDDQ